MAAFSARATLGGRLFSTERRRRNVLKLRKGAVDSVMPRELWFALGIAHATHSMFNLPDLVVTDHKKPDPDNPDGNGAAHVVKLRVRDMREFDQQHWCMMLSRHLDPMGFTVYSEVQHLVIEYRPDQSGRVHHVETETTTNTGGNECPTKTETAPAQ
jgi:hypothetical protein